MKDYAEQAAVNGQSFVVIVNKAVLPEIVHKMTDPRPGRANHLRQHILAYSWNNGLGLAVLTKIRSN